MDILALTEEYVFIYAKITITMKGSGHKDTSTKERLTLYVSDPYFENRYKPNPLYK